VVHSLVFVPNLCIRENLLDSATGRRDPQMG